MLISHGVSVFFQKTIMPIDIRFKNNLSDLTEKSVETLFNAGKQLKMFVYLSIDHESPSIPKNA